MKKRILSVLLTLVMLIGLVPVMSISASASALLGDLTDGTCYFAGETVNFGAIKEGDILQVGTIVTFSEDYYDTQGFRADEDYTCEIKMEESGEYLTIPETLNTKMTGFSIEVSTKTGFWRVTKSSIKGPRIFWSLKEASNPLFAVFFNANGGSDVSTIKSATYGSYYSTLPTSTRTGYTFAGWYTAASGGIKVTADSTVTKDTLGDLTLYAHWTANTYTVSFNANGGSVNTASKTVTYDSTYGTLPTPTKTGYTFAGWYTAASGGTQVTESTKVQITSAQTLYAHWTANAYTVSFHANGGSVSTTSKTVTYDSPYGTLPTPTRTGYTFAGWYTAESSGTKVTGSTKVQITSAQTLYAHWTVNTYTVSFNANGGSVNTASKTVTYDSTYGTLPTPTKTGYTFAGWYTAESSGTQVTESTKVQTASDHTLYAQWTVNKYTVTFQNDDGTTLQSGMWDYGSTPTYSGTTPTKAATPAYTYTFAGWDNTIATVTGDATYIATYNSSLRTYGATVGESQHGSVTLAPTSALVGGEITVFITPDAGYAVDTVTVNGTAATKTAENQYTFAMPATDAVVDVTYKKIPYSVSLFNGGSATGGVFSADLATATIGDTVTVTVTPNLGYLIESVSVNGAAATNNGGGTYSFTMPAQNVLVSVAFDVDLPAIAKELQLLNDADAALKTAINNGDNDLSEEIDALNTAINSAIAALEKADSDNKKALEDKIDEAKSTLKTAIDKVAADLEAAKADLQSKIDAVNSALAQKADAATTTAAIQNLQAAVAALEAVKDDYATADATLKAELEGKIANAQTAAISAAETLVNNAKAELQSKIDAKADAATTTVAIQNLEAAVAALEAVKDDYATADATLKAELEGKIANAQTAAISAAETLVNNAKAELQSKIDAKADAATTTAAIQNLQTAVAALESVKDDYATADAALKTELEGKISAAQTAAISAAETLVNNAKAELTAAINNKADTATLNAKINELNTAIATAEATAKAYTDGAAAALTTAIATAKSEAISAAETLVNNAKSELQSAIDTKADATTVNAAITNLQNAIAVLENAKDNYVSADAALKAELEGKITSAQDILQAAIDKVQENLDDAKAELNKAIADLDAAVKAGDKDLSDKILNLSEALAKTTEALEEADAANKAELERKIEDANKALKEAIVAVQKNLNAAQQELKNAITAGDSKLDEAIQELKKALEDAIAAYELADETLKAELVALINQANETQESAIAQIRKNLEDSCNALQAKDDMLNKMVIVALVIGGIAVFGNIVLLVWFIKKRKA